MYNKVWNISLEVGEKSAACTTLQFLLLFKQGSFLSFRGNARLPIAMSPERFHLILTETGAKKGGAKVTGTILSRRSETGKKEEFCDSPCGLKTRNFCFSSPVTPDRCFFFLFFKESTSRRYLPSWEQYIQVLPRLTWRKTAIKTHSATFCDAMP